MDTAWPLTTLIHTVCATNFIYHHFCYPSESFWGVFFIFFKEKKKEVSSSLWRVDCLLYCLEIYWVKRKGLYFGSKSWRRVCCAVWHEGFNQLLSRFSLPNSLSFWFDLAVQMLSLGNFERYMVLFISVSASTHSSFDHQAKCTWKKDLSCWMLLCCRP